MEKKRPVQITYLFNSGFVLETEKHLLVFDYYRDAAGSKTRTFSSSTALPPFLKTDKPGFIFVSHRHADHYNPVILEWGKLKPELNYILSSDIKPWRKGGRIALVSPGEARTIGPLFLKVFGSTDQGVSFWVEIEGLRLFHAGDLNWWHWWDDSEAEQAAAEEKFKAEIGKLKGEPVDLAFFPVDPRLGEYYYLGGAYFLQQLQPDLFIPMHFGTEYQITERFARRVHALPTRVVTLHQSPQKFFYNEPQL